MANKKKRYARTLQAKTNMGYQAALMAGLRGKEKAEQVSSSETLATLPNPEVSSEALSPPRELVLGFRQWLKQFKEDDTPRGDLARDVDDDLRGAGRREPSSRAGWVGYLNGRGASSEAVEAMREAWDDYEAFRGGGPDGAFEETAGMRTMLESTAWVREAVESTAGMRKALEATAGMWKALESPPGMRMVLEHSDRMRKAVAPSETIRKMAEPLEKLREAMEPFEKLREAIEPFEKLRKMVAPPDTITKMVASIEGLVPRITILEQVEKWRPKGR